MDYKKSYRLLIFGIWSGAALVFAGLNLASYGIAEPLANTAAFLGISFMLCSIAQALFFYKCPCCKKSLYTRGKRPDYCPSCGYKLDL